jgi:SAM-dependent methyltransferase
MTPGGNSKPADGQRMRESTRFRIEAARRAAADPLRTVRLLASGVGWRRLRYAVRPPAHGGWTGRCQGLDVRGYPRYEDYIAHQRSKLSMLDLSEYNAGLRTELAGRLRGDGLAGRAVLCLGARLGAEVQAFHDVGAFAVGVDIEPGLANQRVLHGDFHRLVFPDGSADVVYCNCLDHALDLPRVLAEIHRVLKPGGLLLVDAQHGTERAGAFDDWAATSWPSVEDLLAVIGDNGFSLDRRRPLSVPQPGEELRLRATRLERAEAGEFEHPAGGTVGRRDDVELDLQDVQPGREGDQDAQA